MRNSLKFKVGFYLVIALTVAVLIFTLMIVRHNREGLLQQAQRHSAQLADVVIKSTRFAMLQNKRSQVSQIIQDVGANRASKSSGFSVKTAPSSTLHRKMKLKLLCFSLKIAEVSLS